MRNFATFSYRPRLDYESGVIENGLGARVRRLVSLGAPILGPSVPAQELAVYGASDPIIPVPDSTYDPRTRVLIVPGCGHVGLLYYQAVLHAVATFPGYPLRRRAGRGEQRPHVAVRRRARPRRGARPRSAD